MHENNAHALDMLNWALSSPDLLAAEHAPFALCRAPEAAELECLNDKGEQPLIEHLSRTKSHFIGPLFEALWLYYLTNSPNYELVAHNQQFQSQGKTLGEIDFLVFDKQNESLVHQELAVKFYLKTNLDHDPKPYWVGPNAIDRLDLKLAKFEQQLALSKHPQIRERFKHYGLQSIRTEVVLKGMLFHQNHSTPETDDPLINPAHLKGQWQHMGDFIDTLNSEPSSEYCWRILSKPLWMTSLNSNSARSATALSARQLRDFLERQDQSQRAHLVSRWLINDNEEIETSRLMLVPSSWPNRPHSAPTLQTTSVDK